MQRLFGLAVQAPVCLVVAGKSFPGNLSVCFKKQSVNYSGVTSHIAVSEANSNVPGSMRLL